MSLRFSCSQGTNVAFMSKYLFFSLVVVLGCLTFHGVAHPQAKPPQLNSTDTKSALPKFEMTPDYAKEAFIDEEELTKDTFENEGTHKRDLLSRVRIQSDAGVQRFSVISFAYQSAVENIDIDYVRVTKPDKTVVTTPLDDVQDMPSDITRQAPFYSDIHEKHVAVKGLTVGDVLEWKAHWNSTKPLVPGQFWSYYNFTRDAIVLHQEFQVSVPKERALKWKSPGVQPTITDEGSRRIFSWVNSQLTQKSSEQEKKVKEEALYQTARGKLPPADVQLSTFQNWAQIGAWYNSLQQERVKPSEEIRAKAADLTRSALDDDAKLRAIYAFVSTQFRYIGVAFGIGRYQPHSAAEVLANQYGDCKDKHTLLASLLDAAGFKAYPALISTFHELDADVPSPSQFDHVITAVTAKNGYSWLDTTAEVAPFGYLIGVLRDKPALVVREDDAKLVTTPADPPMKAVETFHIDAKLSSDGTLHGKIERTASGDDSEVLLRAGFRRTALAQWKELVQQFSYASGFAGDVSEVNVTTPEKTDTPFTVSYTYNRKDFPDWSNKRISSPLPPALAVAPEDKPDHPILLGAIEEYRNESRVELPDGYSPVLPKAIELKEDFGEYHASYVFERGTLRTVRTLTIKKTEVPVAQYEVYKKFAQAVSDDYARYVELESSSSPSNPLDRPATNLASSEDPEALQSLNEALADLRQGKIEAAVELLNDAVNSDPKFVRAWITLAQLHATMGNREMGVATLEKAYAANPTDPVIYKALVSGLMTEQYYDRAVSVLQDVVKRDPSNVEALTTLGAAFSASKQYDEAVKTIESAIKLKPTDANLQTQLGSTYIAAGMEEKAVAAYKKAVEISPTPNFYNNAGYDLADAKLQLPLALEYVEKAVRDEEQASAKTVLSDLKKEDLGYPGRLSAYWDSLGWVHFRLGNFGTAEKYLRAAWELTQGPVQADHLGQTYEQEHKKEEAIRMYRLALAASRVPDRMKDTKDRLERLKGSGTSGRSADHGFGELSELRTIQLDAMKSYSGTAEFFVLFGPDAKVEDTKFVSGSEKLKDADKFLRSAPFKTYIPDNGPTKLLRRGVLMCSSISGCNFVLYTPDSVRSIN